ncbi:MAG: sugar phosphate isomerase/epimerase [Patescibacteria group bacterium]|nr:sugar phosphate isomerase/epimerase [Patescibacteria group bacterium]
MLLLSTGTLYKYGLNRIFHFAKKLRYEGIELIVNDVADMRNIEYLRELQKQYDLPIEALAVPHNSNIEKTKAIIEMADDMGIGIVVVRAPLWTDFVYTQWVKKNLSSSGAITSRHICIENPPQGDGVILPKYAFGNINDLATFKSIALDTMHLFSRQLDLMRVYEKFKPQIKYIRLSDSKRGRNHMIPGDGVLPLESFLAHLNKNQYKGHISIKIDYEEVGGGDDVKAEKALTAARKFYEEYFLNSK